MKNTLIDSQKAWLVRQEFAEEENLVIKTAITV